MTDLRKAAEKVLQENKPHGEFLEALDELRQALAQPEQEPVGYVTDSGTSAYFLKGVDLDDDTPLYTAPPKRQWVGLTDEERFLNDCRSPEEIEYAIAIEAKLKEKNGG